MGNPEYNRKNLENSHWYRVTPPGPVLPELDGPVESEVVIVGAGFTGLSTALHLLEAGKSVAVVALARRLAVLLYTMWSTDTAYDATRLRQREGPAA